MKHLLLFILFSGSLDSFSQDILTQYPSGLHYIKRVTPKPDTLRAICLVTLGYHNLGIAHARMGFVVLCEGKEPVYLDCRKRALKLPQVGWGWRVVNPIENVK